jgi:hypothetical protein
VGVFTSGGIPNSCSSRIAFRGQSGRIVNTLLDRMHRKRVEPEPWLELARTLMARAMDPNAGRERFRAAGWG